MEGSPRAQVGPEHAPPIPASLSCLARKRALYGADTYFRESWEDARELLGADAGAFAATHAVAVVKPDAVATRCVDAVLDWLAGRGIAVVAAERCLVTPRVLRAGWQYSWNQASRDRRDLADLFWGAGDSLVLLVRGEADGEVPFSIALGELKGPPDPGACRPGELRHGLGHGNYLLNFVHTTDEPADVVRELGVFLDAGTRRSVYRAVRDGADALDRARRQAEEMYAGVPRQDLRLEPALDRVAEAVAASAPSPARDEALAALEAVRSGGSRDWRGLLSLAERAGAEPDRWTRIVVGTHLMTASEPGREPLIGDVTREDWLASTASAGARA